MDVDADVARGGHNPSRTQCSLVTASRSSDAFTALLVLARRTGVADDNNGAALAAICSVGHVGVSLAVLRGDDEG
jgi:hypothetical protein